MAMTLTHRQLTERLVADFSSHRQLTEKMLAELLGLKEYVIENTVTKTELHAVRDELMNHIDGLNKRTDTNDQEITAQRFRTERLEGRVSTVENRLGVA